MVSGPTGASRRLSDFFRDFAESARGDAFARAEKSGEIDAEFVEPKPLRSESVAMADDPYAAADEDLVNRLRARNLEVVTHEGAHLAGAGAYVEGGVSYTYQTGPDGVQYAIGGEVRVDMSPVPGNPRATIAKMMAIRAAALSPDEPSAQDAAVASATVRIEAQARAQLQQEAAQTLDNSLRAAAGRYTTQAPSPAGAFVNATA